MFKTILLRKLIKTYIRSIFTGQQRDCENKKILFRSLLYVLFMTKKKRKKKNSFQSSVVASWREIGKSTLRFVTRQGVIP